MTKTDQLVSDYLARLDLAAQGLGPERRAELVAEIGEHITSAREGGADGEAGVRTVLDRLGSPEEIAAAAREEQGSPGWGSPGWGSPGWGPPVVLRRRGTGPELAAVVLLTVGSLLPVVGWLVGVALLWTSPRWRVREKLAGTLLFPFGPGAALIVGAVLPFRTESCVSEGPVMAPPGALAPAPGAPPFESTDVTCTTTGPPAWFGPVLLALLVLVPVVVAVLLYRTAVRRAAAEPPEPVAHGSPASPWGPLEVSGVLVLALGGLLLPVGGTLVGVVLVCCSPRWTGREKAVAAALALLPLLLPLSLLIARIAL